MKTIGLGIGLVVVLALRPAVGQNIVVNGDFEGGFAPETHLGLGYYVPNGWSWYPWPADGSKGRIYRGLGLGMDGSDCPRIRLIQNVDGDSILFQTINTVPGTAYTFRAYWKLGPAGSGGGCTYCQPLIPWIGAFFINGGTGEFFSDHDLVANFVPNAWRNHPNRAQWPYTPPEPPTEPIIPLSKEIVAEHAYHYGYDLDYPLDYWESIYDAAGGAGEPAMPGIGESAANGGGAAWQTKVATGDHMIIGFFVLDAPSTTGDGTDLYIDNVEVTPGPFACPADFDNDGDVDLTDFNAFQACFNGPNRPARPGCTEDADFEGDNDVDLGDFNVFQNCFNGPNRPPRCS